MQTKRLSAKGVHTLRERMRYKDFSSRCDDNCNIHIPEAARKRFWDAKAKIDAEVYSDCCEVVGIHNPSLFEDRTPLEVNISLMELARLLRYSPGNKIKSTDYNEITLDDISLNLEPNFLVLSGKWVGSFRDDYPKDLSKVIEFYLKLTPIKEISIVEYNNKKFWQLLLSGNFTIKYLVNLENGQIQVAIIYRSIELDKKIDNNIGKLLFEFTKYEQRIIEPITKSELIAASSIQELIQQKVGHTFFNISELCIESDMLRLKVDESYISNKEKIQKKLVLKHIINNAQL